MATYADRFGPVVPTRPYTKYDAALSPKERNLLAVETYQAKHPDRYKKAHKKAVRMYKYREKPTLMRAIKIVAGDSGINIKEFNKRYPNFNQVMKQAVFLAEKNKQWEP